MQKRLDFFKANGDENYESSLLQTIRVPKNLLFLTDRLPQANYEKIPNKKNMSFHNSSLPDVKSHKKRESRKQERGDGQVNKKDFVNQASVDQVHKEKEKTENGKDRHSEMEPQVKARNVVSLQPHRNEDIEMIKKKNRIKEEKSPEGLERDSSVTNIRVVKPLEEIHHREEKSNDMMLPNIKGSGAINYEIKYDPSPKRK